MSDLPIPHHDLAAVFRAMSRGTKRSKLRVAAVVCPNDHTVVEVYKGTSGTLWGLYPTERPGSGRSTGTKDHYVADLHNTEHAMPGMTVLSARSLWCRCRDADLVVFVEHIRSAIEAGQRRIVLTQDSVMTEGGNDELVAALDQSGGSREFLLGTPTHRA